VISVIKQMIIAKIIHATWNVTLATRWVTWPGTVDPTQQGPDLNRLEPMCAQDRMLGIGQAQYNTVMALIIIVAKIMQIIREQPKPILNGCGSHIAA